MLVQTATELPRLVGCNGNLQLPDYLPFNEDKEQRDEGDAAHWLIQQVFERRFGTDELVDRKAFNGYTITSDMVDYCIPYLTMIQGRGEVEVECSYGDGLHYQVNGRADHLEYNAQLCDLVIDDFKFGWSIIEPQDNWTLISHALAWMFKNPDVEVRTITLRVTQPRPHHILGKIRSHTYSVQDIWAKWTVLQYVLMAPNNLLHTGPWCYKCKKLPGCPAAQKEGLHGLEISEVAYVSEMDNGSLAITLKQYARAIKVLEGLYKATSELALHRLKKGAIIEGWNTEKELSNLQWKDGMNADTLKMLTGQDLRKQQLITPTQAIAKANISPEVMNTLAERRQKGVKLVQVDAATVVKKMFGDVINN